MKACVLSLAFQVATFILQKILLDDTGLAYICQTYERFSHVAMILVSFSELFLTERLFYFGGRVKDSFQLDESRPQQFFMADGVFLSFRAKWSCSSPKSRRLGCWSTLSVVTCACLTTPGWFISFFTNPCNMPKDAEIKVYLLPVKASTLLSSPFVLVQSQRSAEAVPPWPAQRHHFCPSLEGRHHHQALAGPAGEEPAGGAGHRSQRHSSSSTVTPSPITHLPNSKNTSSELPNSRAYSHGHCCFYERLSKEETAAASLFLVTDVQTVRLRRCTLVRINPQFSRVFLLHCVPCNLFSEVEKTFFIQLQNHCEMILSKDVIIYWMIAISPTHQTH